MLRALHVASFLVIAVLAGACATTPPEEEPEPAESASTATPGEAALPPEVLGATWEWVAFTSPVEQLTIDNASQYTISFERDGRFAVQADCNRGMGSYTVTEDRRITLGQMALTRAACPPGSLSDRYVDLLGRVAIYFMRGEAFYLELPVDSGTLEFRRRP